ncbi:hypothetical protein NX773_12350 [Massilia solisilvae]|uniref:NHL repeat-containing protein n=1 Tax=Massilia solisilvae TaxID=1811225 RepID=A0ABT2BKC4_9BURK|nr:hypothetical protein [Massilia solisilvae]MCS0608957.1 hypothetical protein [Massilia solisilvae]
MNKYLRAGAFGGAIALLLTACGGGGSASPAAPDVPPPVVVTPPPPVALHAELIAGQADQPLRFADGTLASARFAGPTQVAFDKEGNLYVADGNLVIRKITAAGQVSTLAGSVGNPNSVDGTGSGASFQPITGMAVDTGGNVYLSSSTTVRKVTPAGVVTTLAGKPFSMGLQDGPGADATFSSIKGLAVDGAGNVYVGDYQLRRITPAGNVQTVNLDTQNRYLTAIAVDSNGGMTVSANYGTVLQRFDAAGKLVQTIGASDGAGAIDGSAAQARFNQVSSIAYGPNGALYVTDNALMGTALRTVDAAGNVKTLNPDGTAPGLVNGPVTSARFGDVRGLAFDKAGSLFLADAGNNVIRKLAPDLQVSTYAGDPAWTQPPSFADGKGAAAAFRNIAGFAYDKAGNYYVADAANCAIRKIDTARNVTTLAGAGGQCGYADGAGSAARFDDIRAITQDADGNLYVAEKTTVRKVTLAGVVSTVAGVPGTYQKKDGVGGTFQNLLGIAMGPAGYLLVSDGRQASGFLLCNFDYDNAPNSLRTVTLQGEITTPPGSEWSCADRDKAPALWGANDLRFDSTGNLYLVSGNSVAMRSTTGVVSYLRDGQGNKIAGYRLAPDDAGNLFFISGNAIFKYGADKVLKKVLGPAVPGNPIEITTDLPFQSISALAYIGNRKFLASFDSQVVIVTLN